MPAPFLSVLIDDCIANGRDYNAGGSRYNNTFIQMVGLGSITDCLSAAKELCFEKQSLSLRKDFGLSTGLYIVKVQAQE